MIYRGHKLAKHKKRIFKERERWGDCYLKEPSPIKMETSLGLPNIN